MLPGFREGMRNVSLDEQRHIGFGVKLLADLYREDPGPIQDAIVGLIKEVLPWTSAVAKPPNWDRSYTECFGFTLEDLGESGAASIEQRLRAIGLPVDTIPGFPMPMDLPPRERAMRGQKLLRAGLIGPGDEGVPGPGGDRDHVRHHPPPGHRRRPAARAPRSMGLRRRRPWHVVLENGASRAVPGHAPRSADLTLRLRFADWADVMAGRADPRALMLRRRLRPKGSPRVLLAFRRSSGRAAASRRRARPHRGQGQPPRPATPSPR